MCLHYNVDDYWNNGRDAAFTDVTKIAGILNAKIVTSDLNKQNREHILGTMIMGNSVSDSVVNADCRTHGHLNLYIAGTSVSPAVGCVNPTLTAPALALRLVDHLITSTSV